MNSKFPCTTIGMERFSLDLLRAVKNREYPLRVAETCFEPS